MKPRGCRCPWRAGSACAGIVCGRWRRRPQATRYAKASPSLRAQATSNPALLLGYGLLRGACHRAALCADPLARNDGSNCPDFRRLLRRSRKQQQIAIRVRQNKISRAPGLALERLKKRYAGGLKLEEERFDFLRRRDGERGGQQLLTVSHAGIDHRLLDASQVDQRGIAPDLCIERRLAIGERDGEAELAGEEIARRLDIGDEQLRFGTGDDGFGENSLCMI